MGRHNAGSCAILYQRKCPGRPHDIGQSVPPRVAGIAREHIWAMVHEDPGQQTTWPSIGNYYSFQNRRNLPIAVDCFFIITNKYIDSDMLCQAVPQVRLISIVMLCVKHGVYGGRRSFLTDY